MRPTTRERINHGLGMLTPLVYLAVVGSACLSVVAMVGWACSVCRYDAFAVPIPRFPVEIVAANEPNQLTLQVGWIHNDMPEWWRDAEIYRGTDTPALFDPDAFGSGFDRGRLISPSHTQLFGSVHVSGRPSVLYYEGAASGVSMSRGTSVARRKVDYEWCVWASLPHWAWALLFAVLPVGVLVLNLFRAHERWECPGCLYDLRGRPDASACPECGRGIDAVVDTPPLA